MAKEFFWEGGCVALEVTQQPHAGGDLQKQDVMAPSRLPDQGKAGCSCPPASPRPAPPCKAPPR